MALRFMTEADVAPAQAMAAVAIDDVFAALGESPPAPSPARTARGRARFRHCLGTDPEGAWVAEAGGTIVGCCLALRRGGRLFGLSMLAVAGAHQGQGIGGGLLARALDYGSGCEDGLIVASPDARAVRTYAGAGFRLEPAYSAQGVVDRARLPAVSGIREAGLADAELIADVDRKLRGAPHGEDLRFLLENGARLTVGERGADRGYVVAHTGRVAVLGATEPELARDLLWAALAAADEAGAEVRNISARQPWAVEVVLAARLRLSPIVASICVRGDPGPLAPYLPSGPFL